MGSSGLIYAAIVAAWGAVLIPRWLRRGEEVDQAREEDLARGVRVLADAVTAEPTTGHGPRSALTERTTAAPVMADDVGEATRRRRWVIAFLSIALLATTVAAVLSVIPLWSVAVPAALLAGFIALARRAAAVQARRAARRARTIRTPAARVNPPTAEPAQRAEPVRPVDSDAWEPVPVPLPTYLLKPKAEPVVRKINLPPSGAWTSNRLDHVAADDSPARIGQHEYDVPAAIRAHAVGD